MNGSWTSWRSEPNIQMDHFCCVSLVVLAHCEEGSAVKVGLRRVLQWWPQSSIEPWKSDDPGLEVIANMDVDCFFRLPRSKRIACWNMELFLENYEEWFALYQKGFASWGLPQENFTTPNSFSPTHNTSSGFLSFVSFLPLVLGRLQEHCRDGETCHSRWISTLPMNGNSEGFRPKDGRQMENKLWVDLVATCAPSKIYGWNL